MVEIRISPFGGQGLFATKDFSEDDNIIEESPFISILDITASDGNPHNHWTTSPLPVSGTSEAAQRIQKAMSELDEENQNLFWSFSQAEIYGVERTVHGIFYTNYIDVTPADGPDIGCMYRHICRLNHSCKPNAYWYYKQAEDKLALFACRDIKACEELFVDYCGHDECDEWYSSLI